MVYLTGCLLVPGNLGPSSLVGINGRGERINVLKWNEITPLHADVRFYPSGSLAIQTGLLQERIIATLFFYIRCILSVIAK